ncbi:VPEID-CTERM sorting domain-containing protein [Ruegeria pomeroyi]|uniref:VPEID-CTERM sorting domain-containing protein n=1 Tax=Ruegeria alba TaxID=2916756 RepID=A0ABS9NQU6_9RHOB|nr:VPEID-CTERM sorting domain-containing protein [Ruegeria alba]MCE8511136.1 VPEID-CTERM sorting domain-containing protein [Ruegeria pomeroyi]MCE8519548.1 VPEID-CTERM sorting domain-containing protein [Ruegeria pomeroyi]MCE8524319.1 VPEID-CTERM sorting domain-containing protein [Ruegeria pomeroyi]MCE8528223.1 VPEID-CTERM sorting domain-containing protein [Ruegeria pomeroyi]MCE8531948.1 VPEID-CTERM sorting domain-containing protein [Ruegeria pomeroyi]
MFSKSFAVASAALSALVLTTQTASAQTFSWSDWWGGWSYGGGSGSSGGTSSAVPEIDASTGALALAAVAAGLLLARELRRRKTR